VYEATNSYFKDHGGEEQLKAKTGVRALCGGLA